MHNSRDSKEVDDGLKELRDNTSELSKFLMGAEMVMVEQLEDVLKDYERNYTEINTSINETGQASFARLRDIETEFHEKLTEAIMAMYDRFNKGDVEEIDDDIRDILGDKDGLMNAVNSSHDFRLSQIDSQDDMLVSGLVKELENVVKTIGKNEVWIVI